MAYFKHLQNRLNKHRLDPFGAISGFQESQFKTNIDTNRQGEEPVLPSRALEYFLLCEKVVKGDQEAMHTPRYYKTQHDDTNCGLIGAPL